MKNNFKILSLLLILAMMIACGSIPHTMGPYKEADAKNTASQNAKNTQTQAQAQQTSKQTQTPKQQQTQEQTQSKQNIQNNYEVREETFSMVSISDAKRLKTYNVIVGSFSVEENAKKLKKSLQPEYDPIIVINEKGMFRVIIASFDNYEAALEEINKSIRHKFPDVWILAQKR